MPKPHKPVNWTWMSWSKFLGFLCWCNISSVFDRYVLSKWINTHHYVLLNLGSGSKAQDLEGSTGRVPSHGGVCSRLCSPIYWRHNTIAIDSLFVPSYPSLRVSNLCCRCSSVGLQHRQIRSRYQWLGCWIYCPPRERAETIVDFGFFTPKKSSW